MDPFNLEDQYLEYLRMAKISEVHMGAVQRIETRRAFYGACFLLLGVMRDKLSTLDDEEAVILLGSMYHQVEIFWNKQK